MRVSYRYMRGPTGAANHFCEYISYRGKKAKKSSNREKIGNKPIPSPMCPKWCPITPLRMVRCTAGCNMVISGWVWSIVGKFLTSFRKELGRPEKSITDQNHISGGRVKNIDVINNCGLNCLINTIM